MIIWNSYKDKRRNRPTSALAREVTRSWPSHPSAAPAAAPAASASASVASALTAAPHNEQCPHISTRTADLDGSWRQSSPRAYCGCSHTYQGLCIEIAAFDYFKHPLHIHGPGDSLTRSGIGRYGETSQAQQGRTPSTQLQRPFRAFRSVMERPMAHARHRTPLPTLTIMSILRMEAEHR